MSAVFAGALRYPRYRWYDRFMIRLIMKMTGGETDTRKEVVYTDWRRCQFCAGNRTINSDSRLNKRYV
jgi:menaquinone-dependent protoporphyrinogen oxidase